MPVQVNAEMVCTAYEQVSTGAPDVLTQLSSLIHNAYNSAWQLNANTTPAVSKVAAFSKALVAGAATIDLTALTGANGATIDGTGLRVQLIKLKNNGTHNMTFKFGATNPYNLLGASWTIILAAGQELLLFGNDAAPVIGPTLKTIDMSGTLVEAAQIIIVMG